MTLNTMRHNLTVQKCVHTIDAGGGYTETWLDIDNNPDIWCAINPLNTSIETKGLQRETVNIHRIRTRYHDDITARHRLIDKTVNRIFRIDTLRMQNERFRMLEIFVSELETLSV